MVESSATRPDEGLAYCLHPTIHGERVAFSAEGNLWEVALTGGVARRLTSSTARHANPCYSPDGKWIAFTSFDEGPASAIWVMPAEGGTARRLTYHAMPDSVAGWTPDSQRILFRTIAVGGVRAFTLASVPVEGGPVRDERYGRSADLAYHADGVTVALGRHGNDPAWWKRYAGGRAGRIWIGNRETGAFDRMAGGPRTDCRPMWIGDTLWFLSDQDGMGDLWRADKDGSNRRRVTSQSDYYIRWPQTDGKRIVYSAGARLYVLDPAETDPTPREIPVDVRGHSLANRRKFVDVPASISSFALSGDGTESLFTVRGRIVRMPNWRGPTRILAGGEGVRFREAQWLGETDRIVAVRQSAEADEVVVFPEDGLDSGDVSELGSVGRRIRTVEPSPDGKWVAALDQGRGVHLLDTETGATRLVHDDSWGWVRSAAWSPCSTWVAFAAPRSWWRSEIVLVHAATGAAHVISGRGFNSFAPAWDPAGRFLAFVSSRDLNPLRDQETHDFGFPNSHKAYVLMLRAGEPVPFAPETPVPEEAPERVTEPIEIDLEGIDQRVYPLPFERARYGALNCTASSIAVLRTPLFGMIEEQSPAREQPDAADNTILVYDFTERRIETAFEKVTGWSVAANGERWLLRFGKRYRVRDTTAKPQPNKDERDQDRPGPKSGWLDLARIAVAVHPRAEFRQILLEAWGLQRDHFYDPSLVQVDWQACLDRYLPLVDRVRTREELIDLLWEMQGELGTSHAYAMGGDLSGAQAFKTGHLGCDFDQDPATGAYVFSRIYAGDPWKPGEHSPLVEPGKGISEGMALLAVDGNPVGAGHPHPGEFLLETSGKQVVLTVADDTGGANTREVTVTPIRDDKPLRYRAWVDANARRVEEATGGRVGYVHIPDMGLAGAIEFHRHFLWQVDEKQAFVIDNRFNGGGNISGIVLEMLARKITGWSRSRWAQPRTYPTHAPRGPMVVLTNENAGSDGDIFSQAVKARSIGPLIGMRTWGGVVGIDRAKGLVDGGFTTQPEYAFWFENVRWGVENHGVEPDIEVDRTPADALRGEDPQLERGIEEVMALLENHPETPPDLGPTPNLGRS